MIESMIKKIENRNIRIWSEDGNIHYKAPEGSMTEDDFSFLRENKNEVLKYLNIVNLNKIIKDECEEIAQTEMKNINLDLLKKWYDTACDAALHSVMNLMQNNGLFNDIYKEYKFNEISKLINVQEKLIPFLHKWLDILVKENILEENSFSYRLKNSNYKKNDALDKWEKLNLLEEKLHFGQGFVDYIEKCGKNLGQLFSGETKALELLFPKGEMDTAIATYQKSMTSVLLNKLARRAVIEIAKSNSKSGIKILEVGAGVGGTSNELIPKLMDLNVEYFFTDVSQYFLNNAKERFKSIPWINYSIYDINKDYSIQNFEEEEFDIILCANVLHNAKNGYKVINNLKEMLKKNGVLVILDETKEPYFLLSSIGFNEGLSNFEDVRKENYGIFFNSKTWDDMFSVNNLEKVYVFPEQSNELSLVGQSVFIVRKNDENIYKNPLKKKKNTKNIKCSEDEEKVYEEPIDNMERAISKIFSEILGGKRVGRNENFFEAGGDSLLVSQVIAKMWKEIPQTKEIEWGELMKDILKEPTVSEISKKIYEKSNASKESNELNWITKYEDNEEIEKLTILVHEGSGTLIPYNNLIESLLRNKEKNEQILGISVYDKEEYLKIPVQTLFKTLGEKYAKLLEDINAKSYTIIGHCVGGIISLEMASYLRKKGKEVELVMISSNIIKDKNVDKLKCLKMCEDVFLERVYGNLIGSNIKKAGYVVEDNVLREFIKDISEKNNNLFSIDKIDYADKEFDYVKKEIQKLLRITHSERLKMLYRETTNRNNTKSYDNEKLDDFYNLFKHNFLATIYYTPVEYSGNVLVLNCKEETKNFFVKIMDAFSDSYEVWKHYLTNMTYTQIEGDHLSCLKEQYISKNYNKIGGNV